MGSRKRSRPNPKVETPLQADKDSGEVKAAKAAVAPNTDGAREQTSSTQEPTLSTPSQLIPDSNSSYSSRGWYASGSWPRIQKASPSTQVARETILADKPRNAPTSVDFSRFEPRKVDATSPPAFGSILPSIDPGEVKDSQNRMPVDNSTLPQGTTVEEPSTDRDSDTTNNTGNTSNPKLVDTQRQVTASGWLEWLGITNSEQKAPSKTLKMQGSDSGAEASCGKTTEQQDSHASLTDPPFSEPTTVSPSIGDGAITTPILTTSWFNVWPGSGLNIKSADIIPADESQTDASAIDGPVAEMPVGTESKRPSPGSTWAFWSKDSRRQGVQTQEPGELAVTGESTQDNPAPAHTTISEESKGAGGKKTNKRSRQLPDDVQEPASKALHSDAPNKRSATHTISVTPSELSQKPTPSQSPAPSKPMPANLLLPSVKSTYRLVENPSIIQQIARLLMHSQQAPTNHVYLVKDPPKIKKALAIGIHGLFPAPLLRTVIGQPTGTSIRFANHAAAAIHRWASIHGSDCEVEKVALEGEGKIAERVDNLWKLLLNWIDHVRSADLIIVACHSQGVPVALMLVAKLIEFSVVTSARIGVCAMECLDALTNEASIAGVSLGPFADYKSRFFSGSAAELFDFANQDSEVSKRYESSLRVALKYGVRVSFVGSIDDQLVSLESAIFSPVNHPYIYRAVFVDGRVHAPDFIAHLVGFALKLRNLGISDHGLIRELSAPLAGSLYTGEGHSRLYDEVKVYDDAVSFTLETTPIGDVPLQVQKFETPTSSNPFQLPWSMRGLLEEDIVKTELDQETAELLKQFDEWKPTTKVLKDVKYRLEAVKSKL